MAQALLFVSRYVVQRGHCIYCGAGMIAKCSRPPYPPNLATLEHVMPRAMRKNRRQRGSVIVLACFHCNQQRGSKTLSKPALALTRGFSRAGDTIIHQLALHLADLGIVCVGRGHADLALQTFAQSPQWREP